jgi:hypothetical protein
MLVPLYGFLQATASGSWSWSTTPAHHGGGRAQSCSGRRGAGGAVLARRGPVRRPGLAPELTVAAAGLTALDRVDVVPEEG